MSSKGIVGELVVITSRMVDVMSREAELLKQGRILGVAALQTEKSQLVDAYAVAMSELRRQPALYVSVVPALRRSEEHTSELQSLMRISYAVFCLKKKTKKETRTK